MCEEEADITSFVVEDACTVLVVKTNFLVRRVHISLVPRPEARCTLVSFPDPRLGAHVLCVPL